MCEFCSLGPKSNVDRDSRHSDFAGFFSADAIEQALRQAAENNRNNGRSGSGNSGDDDEPSDEDSDGT